MSNSASKTSRVYFVLMDIENAPLRATNAKSPLYWDQDLGGEKFTWLGAGRVAKIDGLGSNTQMSIESLTLAISFVQNSDISELDENEYLGRDVNVWQCDLNDEYQVETAVLRFKGHMESASISRGATSTISMSCKSSHADWFTPYYERMNHETQQQLHPDDMGLEYASSLSGLVLKL
jgi:hypothetical protein